MFMYLQAFFLRHLVALLSSGASWQDKLGFAIGLGIGISIQAIVHPLSAYTYLAGSSSVFYITCKT